MLCVLLPNSTWAITPGYSLQGDPSGPMRGWFRMDEGSGTTVENSANYHVCSNPAYSAANWVEIDGTLGGTSNPTWVTPGVNTLPGLTFSRNNKTYVKFLDNSTSCTTGNDPWDWNGSGNDTFVISAYVQLPNGPTCSAIGNKYTIVSKWDNSTQCSYKMYLEVIDKDGGACASNADTTYRLRGVFDDSGGSFSCASPCEIERSTTNLMNGGSAGSQDFHFMMVVKSDSSASSAALYINGKAQGSGASTTCEGGAAIPDPVALNNSTQDLYIGNEQNGGTDALSGVVSTVMIFQLPNGILDIDNVTRMDTLLKFDELLGTRLVRPGDPFASYASLRAIPSNADIASLDTSIKRFGPSSLSLDGTDDAVSSPNEPIAEEPVYGNNIESLTAEAWIRPNNADGGGAKEQTIVARWIYNDDASCTDSTTNSKYRLFLDTAGKLNFEIIDSTGTRYAVTGDTTLQDNQWYHVAGVLTGNTSQYLTADRLYVHVNGIPDTTAPTTFTGYINGSNSSIFSVGYTRVNSPGTTCASAIATNYFEGNIDEVRTQIWNPTQAPEMFNGGVVINEVNYKKTEEEIELYTFADLGHSINLKGFTLKSCINPTKRIQFNDSCADCGGTGSKVVDPGDYVVIKLNDPSTVSAVDTSCSGAATTCTWNSINGTGTNDLRGGDLPDSDSLILSAASNPTTTAQLFASVVDVVYWGSSCTSFLPAQDNLGYWQANQYINVGAITDSTRSIGLRLNGDNGNGVINWSVGVDTMGAPNATGTTAIELVSFTVENTPAGSTVNWITGSEHNTLGFNILYSDFIGEPPTAINSELIAGKGNIGSGADYELTHAHNHLIEGYYYLEEIEVDGHSTVYGPIQAGDLSQSKGTDYTNGTSLSGNGDASTTSFGNGDFSAGGCGRLVAGSPDRASGSLLFFLILVILFSCRTAYLPPSRGRRS